MCKIFKYYISLPTYDGAIKIVGSIHNTILKRGDIVFYKKVIQIAWGELYLISVDVDGEEYHQISSRRFEQ